MIDERVCIWILSGPGSLPIQSSLLCCTFGLDTEMLKLYSPVGKWIKIFRGFLCLFCIVTADLDINTLNAYYCYATTLDVFFSQRFFFFLRDSLQPCQLINPIWTQVCQPAMSGVPRCFQLVLQAHPAIQTYCGLWTTPWGMLQYGLHLNTGVPFNKELSPARLVCVAPELLTF